MPISDARRFVRAWREFCTAPYDFETTQTAWEIQDRHKLNWWDCVLLASASLAHCDLFLSEDLNHQQTIGSLTVLNPFKGGADLLFAN
jgi:predicted nucleic acid-binding protein